MPMSRLGLSTALALTLGAAFFHAPTARAQASPVAFKSNDISVFGGYASVRPDFVPGWQTGETVGLDMTNLKSLLAPSLEARLNVSDGKLVNERTYLFGVKSQLAFFRRYHPYANFLVGIGDIHYNFAQPGQYSGDNSTVYAVGGGVDVDVYNHFALKADVQGQHWNLGHNLIFEPAVVLVGVAYKVPFRRHIKQQDLVQ